MVKNTKALVPDAVIPLSRTPPIQEEHLREGKKKCTVGDVLELGNSTQGQGAIAVRSAGEPSFGGGGAARGYGHGRRQRGEPRWTGGRF